MRINETASNPGPSRYAIVPSDGWGQGGGDMLDVLAAYATVTSAAGCCLRNGKRVRIIDCGADPADWLAVGNAVSRETIHRVYQVVPVR